jgi:hypothetical protein
MRRLPRPHVSAAALFHAARAMAIVWVPWRSRRDDYFFAAKFRFSL